MWTEQEDPESLRGDVAMDDIENNRKRVSPAAPDSSLAGSLPNAQPSNPLLLEHNQDVPVSSPSKQEPKRNKLSLPAADNATVKSLVLSLNNDARWAPMGSHAMRNESTMLELSRGWQTRDGSGAS